MATSRPRAEKSIDVSRQMNPSCHSDPRNGTPNTTLVKPRKNATSTTSIASRDSRNDVRYCHLGMGDATMRFSSFF